MVPNSLLIRFTYFGDTNLDGKIDGSDYSRIDSGFLAHATTWYNGEFNHDGLVDGSDYTLIDNAYNQQSAVISASVAATAVTPHTCSTEGITVRSVFDDFN